MFTHRDDPTRTATIEVQSPDPAVVVVAYTDSKGGTRKKTFKNALLYRAHDAALRFLLNQEGFVIRGPQPGGLRWMTKILQPYRGMIGHAVDPETGVVWVADAIDHAHRIAPDSLAEVELALDSGNTSPGCLAAATAGGAGFVLMLSWQRRPEGGLVRILRLVRLSPDGREAAVWAHVVSGNGLSSLEADAAGRVLGPCSEGAALYGPDGQVVQRWALEPTTEGGNPQGALSRNGEWVVFITGATCQRVHLPSGRTHAFDADIRQLYRVQVADDGTPFVTARIGIPYGLFALGDGPPRRLTEALGAEVSHDGRWVIETLVNQVRLRDAQQRDDYDLAPIVREGHFPVLGAAKTGHTRFGRPGRVVVMTDAYTLAEIDLDRLDPPTEEND
ncbi:MAG: hypothetical protein KC549_17835 [Myxococcales bacterium]|nr:hypothetical protein [Myxococcales bacterium]